MYTRKYNGSAISLCIISTLIRSDHAVVETEDMVDICIELAAFRNVTIQNKRLSYSCISYAESEILKLDIEQIVTMVGTFRHSDFTKPFILRVLEMVANDADFWYINSYYLGNSIESILVNHTDFWYDVSDDVLFKLLYYMAMIHSRYDIRLPFWNYVLMKHESYDKQRNRLLLLHGNRININNLEECIDDAIFI